ncbi:MAG: MerR family transcriptional regulator [Thermodesulfovibrionales bacterium]
MRYLSIGQLAKQAEVTIDTIRYYERRGLLSPPRRKESGYRQYRADTVLRISFIKHAQALGFSLDEIAELLSLGFDSTAKCGHQGKSPEEDQGDREQDEDARENAGHPCAADEDM